MIHLKTYSFLMLLISLPIFAAAGQLSKVTLVSDTHKIVATLSREGQGFGENEVLSFRSSPEGKLLKTMNSEGFEPPVLFLHNGENFIHVSTSPAGSGGFITHTMFWVAPDATMHEIEFENAAEAYENKVDAQEVVLAGGSGVDCTGGNLKFEFYIATNGDPHCCPTGGKVTGNYKIMGKTNFDPITKQYSSTFKMMANQYSRTPISSGEMIADLAK